MNKIITLFALLLITVFTACVEAPPTPTTNDIPFIVYPNEVDTTDLAQARVDAVACMCTLQFKSQYNNNSVIVRASGDACCKSIYVDYKPAIAQETRWQNYICGIPMSYANQDWWCGYPTTWRGVSTGWVTKPWAGAWVFRMRCGGSYVYSYTTVTLSQLPAWTK